MCDVKEGGARMASIWERRGRKAPTEMKSVVEGMVKGKKRGRRRRREGTLRKSALRDQRYVEVAD